MDLIKLIKELEEYRDDTDWKQFFTAKNLTISLSNKAENLHKTFQYKTEEDINIIQKSEKDEIKEELAEAIAYLLGLCCKMGIDKDNIETAIYLRIIKHSIKSKSPEEKENTQNKPTSKIIELKHK